MNFPIVIHKEKDSDYGVTVPDLPGCFSAGSTMDETLAMAKEAIELHLEGLCEEGLPIPEPESVEQHRRNPDFRDGIWAVVSVDTGNLRLKAKRINITMPQRVLDAIDRYARRHNETRSGLLAKAAASYMRKNPSEEQKTVTTSTRRKTKTRNWKD